VAEAIRQQTSPTQPATEERLLAADVGGTYARIGLVSIGGGTPVVNSYRKFACAEYGGLAQILKTFLQGIGDVAPARGAIACAGYVLDDKVINTNLPWPVSLAQVRRDVGLDELLVVNDFTAIAHATGHVDARDVKRVASSDEPLQGPILVVGPGTGLGAALRIPGAQPPFVLSTEAGQAALTASTELEIEVVRHLLRERRHIPVEHILSGPGLATLYATLAALRGLPATATTPADITAAALAGNDELAMQTLHTFCGWLGSTVGNLVLLYGAQGGVYLAGGILPQISEFLMQSDFVERFRDKGAMRPMLERVPVSLIEHGQLGVLGAAGWYLERRCAR